MSQPQFIDLIIGCDTEKNKRKDEEKQNYKAIQCDIGHIK